VRRVLTSTTYDSPPNPNELPVIRRGAEPFDPERAWMLHSRVSVRPEPFGALLYHFGNRRLSFLKERLLLDLVQVLGDHDSARAAYVAVGIPGTDWPRYDTALGALVASGILAPAPNPSTKETL
jgi:putative mycofactocin binding protein MftB